MKEKIIDILTPYIGKTMSESSLNLQCQKMGISIDAISKGDLAGIAQRLQPALKMFIGDGKANQILDTIKNL